MNVGWRPLTVVNPDVVVATIDAIFQIHVGQVDHDGTGGWCSDDVSAVQIVHITVWITGWRKRLRVRCSRKCPVADWNGNDKEKTFWFSFFVPYSNDETLFPSYSLADSLCGL